MKKFFKVGCLCLVGLIILIIVIAIFAPSPEDEPETKIKEGSNQETVSEPPKYHGNILATTLVEDYTANEIAADMRYKDKTWRITGYVSSTEQSFGSISVVLEGDGFLNTVHCKLNGSEKSKAAMLSKGDGIIVQGKIDGEILGSVMVSKCVILQ